MPELEDKICYHSFYFLVLFEVSFFHSFIFSQVILCDFYMFTIDSIPFTIDWTRRSLRIWTDIEVNRYTKLWIKLSYRFVPFTQRNMQASTSHLVLESAMNISESGLLFILAVCETNIALRWVEHKIDQELKQLIAII